MSNSSPENSNKNYEFLNKKRNFVEKNEENLEVNLLFLFYSNFFRKILIRKIKTHLNLSNPTIIFILI